MNVGIMYFANEKYGLGHHYRCIELAKRLEESGHIVYLLSNLQFRRKLFFQLRPHERYDFYHIVNQCNLDWIVVDTPYIPDQFVHEYGEQFGYKILYLNSSTDLTFIDINIIQGCLVGKYSGPQYVILRSDLDEYNTGLNNKSWFVFGGSADKMNLLKKFSKTVDENAFLAGTEFADLPEKLTNDKHMLVSTGGDDAAFLALMSSCGKACISFGMIAWELVYFNIPTYAFSPTKDHLRWAQAMENEGLIKAYLDVGIPEDHKIKEFLSEDFEIAENTLDLEGANRIVKLMENYG